jgi:hypothetical protein
MLRIVPRPRSWCEDDATERGVDCPSRDRHDKVVVTASSRMQKQPYHPSRPRGGVCNHQLAVRDGERCRVYTRAPLNQCTQAGRLHYATVTEGDFTTAARQSDKLAHRVQRKLIDAAFTEHCCLGKSCCSAIRSIVESAGTGVSGFARFILYSTGQGLNCIAPFAESFQFARCNREQRVQFVPPFTKQSLELLRRSLEIVAVQPDQIPDLRQCEGAVHEPPPARLIAFSSTTSMTVTTTVRTIVLSSDSSTMKILGRKKAPTRARAWSRGPEKWLGSLVG